MSDETKKITGLGFDPKTGMVSFKGSPEYGVYAPITLKIGNVVFEFPKCNKFILERSYSVAGTTDSFSLPLSIARATKETANNIVKEGHCILDIYGKNGEQTEDGHATLEFDLDEEGAGHLCEYLEKQRNPQDSSLTSNSKLKKILVWILTPWTTCKTWWQKREEAKIMVVTLSMAIVAMCGILMLVCYSFYKNWSDWHHPVFTLNNSPLPTITQTSSPSPTENTKPEKSGVVLSNATPVAVETNTMVAKVITITSGNDVITIPVFDDGRSININNGGSNNRIGSPSIEAPREPSVTAITVTSTNYVTVTVTNRVVEVVQKQQTSLSIVDVGQRTGYLPRLEQPTNVEQITWTDTIQPGESPSYYRRSGWDIQANFDERYVNNELIGYYKSEPDQNIAHCAGYRMGLRSPSYYPQHVRFVMTRSQTRNGHR